MHNFFSCQTNILNILCRQTDNANRNENPGKERIYNNFIGFVFRFDSIFLPIEFIEYPFIDYEFFEIINALIQYWAWKKIWFTFARSMAMITVGGEMNKACSAVEWKITLSEYTHNIEWDTVPSCFRAWYWLIEKKYFSLSRLSVLRLEKQEKSKCNRSS